MMDRDRWVLVVREVLHSSAKDYICLLFRPVRLLS